MKYFRHMKSIPFNLLAFAAILCGYTLAAGEAKSYDHDVRKWTVIVPPPVADRNVFNEFFLAANWSHDEWAVVAVDGEVKAFLKDEQPQEAGETPKFDTTVKLADTSAPAFRTLKVRDGWIAAYNQGEFGAAIYWFSPDGKRRKHLSDDQVNAFMVEGDRILAAEGLEHLVTHGSMIELVEKDGQWSVKPFIPLMESAEAITRVAKGDYLVVTTSQLLRVSLDKEVRVLIPDGDWGGLYPNSVAVDKHGDVYIGMRQFVIRCKLGTRVEPFERLVPDRSWLNTKTQ